MTPINELRIKNLREAGWGYKAIAEFCGLTRDEVRSHCTSHSLDSASTTQNHVCQWCGATLEGRSSLAHYCSATCRHKAWEARQLKARPQHCLYCNKPFSSPTHARQKFCSHACYIAWRYKR